MHKSTQFFLSPNINNIFFQNSVEEKKKKIFQLCKILRYHSKKYYDENNPEISDEEFDILFHLLKKWEEKFPDLKLKNSPTEKVMGAVSSKFKKEKHLLPMISLENAFSFEDLQNWKNRFLRILKKQKIFFDFSFIVEPKFDGLGISCIYENGELVRAVTRGDGEEGENVTENVKKIQNIPFKISDVPEIFEIRGEIVMKKSDFFYLNNTLEKSGKKIFSNPRNAASGSLRHLNPNISAKRNLSAFFYEAPLEKKNYSEILNLFDKRNIPHSSHFFHCSTINEVEIAISEIEKLRKNFDFDIDGAVIKINEYHLRDIIGATGHHPRWAIAWKYPGKKVQTILKNVEWQVGRTGIITPVAHLKSVNIDGVNVSRATLHNVSYIQEKNLMIGDTVTIERAGDVIPKILFPHLSLRTGKEQKIEIPKLCPSCKREIVQEKEEVAIKCTNISCPEILKHSLAHFASKKAMNIEGLGVEIAEEIIQKKLIYDLADLYFLEKKDLFVLSNFKEKSVENLYLSIKKSRKNELWRLINALGIPLVGIKTAKNLANHFKSLQNILLLTQEELKSLPDIGEKSAQKIFSFFYQNKAMIKKFLKIFPSYSVNKEIPKQILQNKTFVFTGTLQKFSRDKASEMVERLGGKVLSSVSKKLDFLVHGEKPGSKKTKAQSLGISLLTEEQFIEMIQKNK